MNRKIIVFLILHVFLFSAIGAESKTSDFGKRYPSEKKVITDPVTGAQLTVLTSSDYTVTKPYQTHETWIADGKWIVFHSKPTKDISQIFIVNESTGDIIQLTDYPDVLASTINLSRKEMKLFYIRGTINNYRVIELELDKLIADCLSGKLKAPKNYERVIATLLPNITGTELALDADETCLYWGAILYRPEMTMKAPVSPKNNDKEEQMKFREEMKAYYEAGSRGKSVIHRIDIADGKISKVLDLDFRMGHLQANCQVPGEIIYCKESGGDTDQRTWTVLKDGSNNRPLYIESQEEWITHESMSGADELMFIISGHIPHLREKPSGITTINLRTGEVELLGQVKEAANPGGFWHCNGSPDGRWAVGDTHAGSIYIIDRQNGKRILLSTGHKMRPDHAHPIFSPDGRRILIQSGMLNDGKSLNLMVMNVPPPCLSKNYLDAFPDDASPKKTGELISQRFIPSKHMLHDGKWIHYAEVCTWYGALRFANETGNKKLISLLQDRFEPLFHAEEALLPIKNHVDLNMFGCLPLEFYKITKDKRYFDLGMPYADSQWLLPTNATKEEIKQALKGLSWQTRMWIDDMYMVTIIQSQAYKVTGNKEYINRAGREMVVYLDSLQRSNGLFYHAPEVPFFWARGNSWMAVGMTELLMSLPEDNPDLPRIMKGYLTMMENLKAFRNKEGLWNQLIDAPDFWTETSGSAMFIYTMIVGVKNGWLSMEEYGPIVRKGWLSLVTYLNKDGDLSLLIIIGSVFFYACNDSDDITIPPVDPELLPPNSAQQLGRILPSEKFIYTDTVTGLKWDVLTEPTLYSKRIYPTEWSFTHDSKWVLFFSNARSTHHAGLHQGYLVNHVTGQMIQVTEGSGVHAESMRLSRKSNMLYYLYSVNSTVEPRSTDVDLLLEDAYKGEVKSSDHYIKSICTLPDLKSMDCISLDADELKIYVAFFNYPPDVSVENGGIPAPNPGTTPINCLIMSFDLETKETATVVSTDFQIDHVQANPWVSGEIEFCWETGGKAPQRMWMVNTSDGIKRPLYDEQDTEWITHESWADKDNIAFVARRGEPVPPSEQTKPTGILLVNVRDNTVRELGQLPDTSSRKGYWHCNTTQDLLYATGDTNTGEFKGGEVYLINNTSKKQTSVLARQVQEPDDTHPIFSPDGKYLPVQSGNLSDKKKLCLMMISLDNIPDK